jgi:hypothetical protein
MLPSVRRINLAFPGYGREVRQALESPSVCRQVLESKNLFSQYYSPPSGIHLRLLACDVILETCGIEYIKHRKDTFRVSYGLDYLNTGESYQQTLMYDHHLEKFRIDSIGDLIEMESRSGWYT